MIRLHVCFHMLDASLVVRRYVCGNVFEVRRVVDHVKYHSVIQNVRQSTERKENRTYIMTKRSHCNETCKTPPRDSAQLPALYGGSGIVEREA